MEQRIVFEDKNVSYKTFLEDLATFLAPKIALLIKNPPKKYYTLIPQHFDLTLFIST